MHPAICLGHPKLRSSEGWLASAVWIRSNAAKANQTPPSSTSVLAEGLKWRRFEQTWCFRKA
jgi:hypothetical protein